MCFVFVKLRSTVFKFAATKWSSRQDAIKKLAAYLESGPSFSEPSRLATALLVVVKESTRGFKETNVNVTRAIMEFFLAVCDFHYTVGLLLVPWVMDDIIALAVDKIGDKKLSALCKGLLLNVCLVRRPAEVITAIATRVESVKSPLPHEECQSWFKAFLNEFGASSLGSGIKEVVSWLLKVRNFSS